MKPICDIDNIVKSSSKQQENHVLTQGKTVMRTQLDK